jgi:hypothetical protein
MDVLASKTIPKNVCGLSNPKKGKVLTARMLKAEGIMKMTPAKYQEIVANDLQHVLKMEANDSLLKRYDGNWNYRAGPSKDLCNLCMRINERFGQGIYEKDSFFRFESGKTVLHINTDPRTRFYLPNCTINVLHIDDAKFAKLSGKFPKGIPADEYTKIATRSPGSALDHDINPKIAHAFLLGILPEGMVAKATMDSALEALAVIVAENARRAEALLMVGGTLKSMMGGYGKK